METRKAAPEVYQTSGRSGINTGNRRSIVDLGLAPHVLHALDCEGVHDLADWKRLGKRRLRIFGITSTTATRLDEAAREARA